MRAREQYMYLLLTHVRSVVLHCELALEEDAAHSSVRDGAGLDGLMADAI